MPTTLRLRGRPFQAKPPAPATIAIVKFLDAAPSKEVFEVDQVANKTGFQIKTISSYAKSPMLADYSVRLGATRYWGNPKAIAQLKREFPEAK